MSMGWVRRTYNVPAKRGGRVEYTGGRLSQFGTILSVDGPHLMIRLDGSKHAMPFHPTWELRYLDALAVPSDHRGSGA